MYLVDWIAETDGWKWCIMQWPAPGTACIVVVSPLCELFSPSLHVLFWLGLGRNGNIMPCASLSVRESQKHDPPPAVWATVYTVVWKRSRWQMFNFRIWCTPVWKQPEFAFCTWIICRLSCCSLMDRRNCLEEVVFLAQFCLNPGAICLQWERKWSSQAGKCIGFQYHL